MKENIKKIGLGTAQFGLNYGINNKEGELDIDEIGLILDYSKSIGIELIDTALAYGTSEQKLGFFKLDPFNVVGKFPAGMILKGDILKCVEKSISSLKVSNLYGYLIHDFDGFVKYTFQLDELVRLKEDGIVNKIGYSLYFEKQLDYIFSNDIQVDIIQVPYNIFDNRFSALLGECKNRGIEVHCRSVYLQGLLFMHPNSLKGKLEVFKAPLLLINKILNEYNLEMQEVALWHVVKKPEIDRIILGVDNISQLKEGLKCLTNPIIEEVFERINEVLVIEDESLLLPINW